MSKDLTEGLWIHAGFYAACRKGVTQCVKRVIGYIGMFENRLVTPEAGTGFHTAFGACNHIISIFFSMRPKQGHLGRIAGVLDAAQGLCNRQGAVAEVDVLPLKGTYFTDTESAVHGQEDGKYVVILAVIEQVFDLLLFPAGEYFHFLHMIAGRKELTGDCGWYLVLYSVAQDHRQDGPEVHDGRELIAFLHLSLQQFIELVYCDRREWFITEFIQ